VKVFYRDGKAYLSWGFHELAWSRRTSGFEYPIWDAQGNRVDEAVMYSQKRAGSYQLPNGARYMLTRYFSNSGYPNHKLYILPDLELVASFDRGTEPEDIESLKIPDPIKRYLLRDIFGE